jgi:biotin carboxyl carrier protein
MTMLTRSVRTSINRLVRGGTNQSQYTKCGIKSSSQQFRNVLSTGLLRQQRLQLYNNNVSVFYYSSTSIVAEKDLPYHIVVGLPALSPTMDSGALSEWYVNEGDSFSAGDGIAKIETDKAAMDFEAQDDGYVAKILLQAGQGNDSKYSFLKRQTPLNIFDLFTIQY